MTFLLVLIAVFVVTYQLRRLRREVDELRGELAALRRRLERVQGEAASASADPATAVRSDVVAVERGEAKAPSTAGERVTAELASGSPMKWQERERVPALSDTGVSALDIALHRSSGEMPAAAAGAAPTAARDGTDLETRLGATWTLRIGLGAITVAAGLFARTIVPDLSAALKVAIAYAGAMALVALGRVFEERLARFGRPVMAGGLAIGFFVSFAAHFVPAMRAVPLVVSLVWMAAGVAAILGLATRWRSEPTAGLAILLGHLSAYVAAGHADSYSLVVVLFLSTAAVVLLWRHGWLPLSLIAVVAAYASHLLWGIVDRPGAPAGRALQLSMLFLSSYYAVFLAADLLWWQRQEDEVKGEAAPVRAALGRSLGPVNVVLYATTAAFLYFATGEPSSLTPYLFGTGILQFALTGIYLRLGNPDWTLYPALGTIFVTLGFVSALDALALNVVLASEALVLLLAAHRTGLRVFHLLAQGVLAASFGHYWFVPPGPAAFPLFAGGVLIALAYFTQALLEERWYSGDAGWQAGAPPAGMVGLVATRFDAAFRSVAPYLAHAHAAGGAVILVRETDRFLGPGGAPALLCAAAILAAGALVRRSVPLLLAYGVTHVGVTVAALDAQPGWRLIVTAAASLLLCLALLAGGRRALAGNPLIGAVLIGQATAGATLLLLRHAATADAFPHYLAAVATAALVFLYTDRARGIYAGASSGVASFGRRLCVVASVAAAVVIAEATSSFITPARSAQRGAWLSLWAASLLATSAWRRDAGFYAAGVLLLLVGSFNGWLGAASGPLGPLLFVAAVPLTVAVLQDYGTASHPSPARTTLITGTTAIAYVLGTAVLWALFHARLGEPWYLLGVAGVSVGMCVVNRRALRSTGRDIAVLLMFLVLYLQLSIVIDPLTADTLALLACSLLVATAALLLERAGSLAAKGAELLPAKYTATALVVAAVLLALVALDSGAWRGGAFTTIGYSLAGAALMALGFAARSARHRRVALAVFALTLARAFIVDTRGLSDTGRTLAFLVLGVSLVAVAWLYSRFATRIRQWL